MANRYFYHPFRLGEQGGIAVTADPDRHLRDKLEAVLFTSPGERVNQPGFGAGLNQIVFERMDELTLAALEFRITQALERDLEGELILDDVSLTPDPTAGELTLRIEFRRRTDREPRRLEIRL